MFLSQKQLSGFLALLDCPHLIESDFPRLFELAIADSLSYNYSGIAVTKRTYDKGADIIVDAEDEVFVIQCKSGVKAKISKTAYMEPMRYINAHKEEFSSKKVTVVLCTLQHLSRNRIETAKRDLAKYGVGFTHVVVDLEQLLLSLQEKAEETALLQAA